MNNILTRDIQARDIKKLLLGVYKRYNEGRITEARASRETHILNSVLKALEVTDLEERIINLEQHLKD